jgi:rRNA processing protein Krr1/Pno1
MNLVGVQKIMEFKLDTGAQVNVIPLRLADMAKNFPKLQPVRSRLYGYSGKPLKIQETMSRTSFLCGKHKRFTSSQP